jgi:hypothetical protein
VAGPTLVATLTVLASPALAVVLAGVLAVTGALGVATSGAMRAWIPAGGPRNRVAGHRAGARHAPGTAQWLALMLGFGALEGRRSGVRRRRRLARHVRDPARGVVAGRSAGGLWFGARVVSVSLPRQYRWGPARRDHRPGCRSPRSPARGCSARCCSSWDGDRADAHRAELARGRDRPHARHHRGRSPGCRPRLRRLGHRSRRRRCAHRGARAGSAAAWCWPRVARAGGRRHAGAGRRPDRRPDPRARLADSRSAVCASRAAAVCAPGRLATTPCGGGRRRW